MAVIRAIHATEGQNRYICDLSPIIYLMSSSHSVVEEHPRFMRPRRLRVHKIGRSRGGLTTKNHLVCDGKGRALAFILTSGQTADTIMLAATLEQIRVSTGPDATAARETLENATASEAIQAGEREWNTDYTAVERADAAAAFASVFRRQATQNDATAARARFQARHKTAPGANVPAGHREAWARAAVAPGTSAKLDAARAAERKAIADKERLRIDPPAGTAPTAPRPGTAEQEAQKDAAHTARHQTAEPRQQQQARERGAQLARERQQNTPDKSNAPER